MQKVHIYFDHHILLLFDHPKRKEKRKEKIGMNNGAD